MLMSLPSSTDFLSSINPTGIPISDFII
jgi:hypothetical protein